jgi:hypothetical protein
VTRTMTTAAAIMLAAITTARAVPADDLTVTTLKIDRGVVTNVLMAIDNPSDDGYARAYFSCVFFVKGEPVFEAMAWAEKIVPRGRTIKRYGFSYTGPVDKAECRSTSAHRQ